MEKSCSGSIKSWDWTTPRSWKKPPKMCTVGRGGCGPVGRGLIDLFPLPNTNEAQTWNSLGVQLLDYKDTLDCQTQPAPSVPLDRAHKFEPAPDWTKSWGAR